MTIRAAGAVLWRRQQGRIKVAVVHRPRHDDWSIPKGKLDGEESEADAALREVTEETGYTGVLGEHLGDVTYPVQAGGVSARKRVRYWAMEATHGMFAPNDEVDELRWVTPAEAVGLLSYTLDREVLERFLVQVEGGRAP